MARPKKDDSSKRHEGYNWDLWKLRARQFQRYYHAEARNPHRDAITQEDLARAAALQPDFKSKAQPDEDDWPEEWNNRRSLTATLRHKAWREGPDPSEAGPSSVGCESPSRADIKLDGPETPGEAASIDDEVALINTEPVDIEAIEALSGPLQPVMYDGKGFLVDVGDVANRGAEDKGKGVEEKHPEASESTRHHSALNPAMATLQIGTIDDGKTKTRAYRARYTAHEYATFALWLEKHGYRPSQSR
ncbi:hypothetical protein QBC47DRAFT_441800 [Echria macrotheca]|uniref:Uncharacterized protein n=1 Tax=Echria macrotheca TaxID=438768 RepID=A0AAJ0B4W2_9PEZI|nr:hypothetical protein QBC47DRAFT_441800 [Echria macrotheca]